MRYKYPVKDIAYLSDDAHFKQTYGF